MKSPVNGVSFTFRDNEPYELDVDNFNQCLPPINERENEEFLKNELDKALERGDWEAVEARALDMIEITASSESSGSESGGSDITEDSSDSESSESSESFDDERIKILERLIEPDDWKGLVGTEPPVVGISLKTKTPNTDKKHSLKREIV